MQPTPYQIIMQMRLHGGSFVRGIADAAFVADHLNYDRLKDAFPDVWERYSGMVPAPSEAETEVAQ